MEWNLAESVFHNPIPLGDRSHTIEKKQDLRTKDMEQHQEFINIDESKYISLCVCLFMCLSACVFVCMCVCLYVVFSVCVFVCMCVCMLYSLFVCLSVSVFVCTAVYIVCAHYLQVMLVVLIRSLKRRPSNLPGKCVQLLLTCRD